jgi:hypothetical protein
MDKDVRGALEVDPQGHSYTQRSLTKSWRVAPGCGKRLATRHMKRSRKPALVLGGIALSLASLAGCQTWTAGMTLPSPRYLEHTPQYFPPSPPFPLSRELAQQEAAAAGALAPGGLPPGGPPGPLPPAVPGVGNGDVAPFPPPN